MIPFSLDVLGSLPPNKRLQYVQDHLTEIESLDFERDKHILDEIGLRLVSASPRAIREEYPVMRERMDSYFGHEMSEQEKFEESVIPDGLTPGHHDDDEVEE